MNAVSVRPIRYADVLEADNAGELLAEYGAECSIPQIGPICPQAALYAAMEASGNFQVFGAYGEAGELIGFASVLVYVVPHYGRRIATVESLFLAAARRTGRVGNLLMNAMEDYARERACEAILYNARAGSQFEKLLALLKPYERTNSVFLRSLRRLPT